MTKKLQEIYSTIKGTDYWTFKSFYKECKNFVKDIKKRQVICAMKVSKSGMTRHFNFQRYNWLLNGLYNKKWSNDPVKVQGCGMDMYWYLLFRSCEMICTEKEIEKYNLNSLCSHQTVLYFK